MSLDFVNEIYQALRYHIDFNDQKDAADTLVNLLIDHDYEPEEIKESFRGSKEVLVALKDYLEEHDLGEEYEEEYEEDDDEWN
jgi:hypothetical protein